MSIRKEFSDLLGKTLIDIGVSENEILFVTSEGKSYKMFHDQSCCESVYIEDICGIPTQDLIGDPILIAEEKVSTEERCDTDDSKTWTFYELATIKGSVTIRWLGESNGYYSEAVDFEEINENEQE